MKFKYDDGGRGEAGYKGVTGDCVCRAVAIATGKPYQEIANRINELGALERITKRKKDRSHYRTGVYNQTTRKLLAEYGFTWFPIMGIGTGCTMHLRTDEVPEGEIVVKLSRHITAVKDKVVHDLYDPSRGGERCVYGYWKKVIN